MATRGAVLTGGTSRRMGRTKALIDVDGVPMARRVADALSAGGCAEIVLVGGDAQELEPLGIAVVADRFPGAGPLGGVLSALAWCDAGDDIVVAACDLPRLDATSIAALIAAARSHPMADVVVARTDRIEPACALWRESAMGSIERLFGGGMRALHLAIEQLASIEVDVAPAALANVNRPDELPGT